MRGGAKAEQDDVRAQSARLDLTLWAPRVSLRDDMELCISRLSRA
jgi:hypothetical protein